MAKLTNPYFSIDAHRQGPPGITLRRRDKTTIAERTPVPSQPHTPAQEAQRANFQTGIIWWKTLPPATKEQYRLMNPAIGYNAAYLNFMKEWLMTLIVSHHTQHEAAGTDKVNVKDLAGLPPPHHLEYLKHGNYHVSPLATRATYTGSLTIVADRLYAFPYPIGPDLTFDRIALNIIVGAAGNMHLGSYLDNGTTYPGALISDDGIIPTTPAGLKSLATSINKVPQLIWLAMLADSAPQVRVITDIINPILGSTDALSGLLGYVVVNAYGALPATYPAAATPGNALAFIALRRQV